MNKAKVWQGKKRGLRPAVAILNRITKKGFIEKVALSQALEEVRQLARQISCGVCAPHRRRTQAMV